MSHETAIEAKLDRIIHLLEELVRRDQQRLRTETTAARRLLDVADERDGGAPVERLRISLPTRPE